MKTVLSPTALKTFMTCPRKYQAQYVTRELKWSQSDAAARGDRLHALMESAVLYGWNSITWPEQATQATALGFVQTIERLKQSGWKVSAELKTAIDRDGHAKDWWDKAPDSFLRSKIDVCAWHPKQDYAIVVDWKTGKKYELDTLQLACNAMCLQPVTKLAKYRMMFAYIDSGEVVEHSCELPSVPFAGYCDVELHPDVEHVRKLVEWLEEAEAKDRWPEKRNRFCHWCGVEDCRYGKS